MFQWCGVCPILSLQRGVEKEEEECVHEDFIYIRETEMFTRDEFRSEVIEEFVQGVMISKNLQV